MAIRIPANRSSENCRRLVVLLAILLIWLLLPQPSSAHATLLGTNPTDGAQLDQPPAEVVLTFSEPVGIVENASTLVGNDIDTINLNPTLNGSDVTIPIPTDLPDGDYLVQWRVISTDSHPIFGTVSFTIGEGSGESFAASQLPGWVDVTRVVTVWAKYLGLLTAAGLLLIVRVVNRRDMSEGLQRVFSAIVVAIVGTLAELPLAAIEQIGKTPSGIGALFDAIGHLDTATLASAAVSVVFAGIALIAIRMKLNWQLAAAALVVALLSQLISGHTRSKDPTWLMFIADAIHLLAAAMWIGGIVLLALGLANRWGGRAFADEQNASRSVTRFSTVAAYLSAAVAVSGVTMAITILRSWDALFDTDYGMSLMIKVGAVAVVILLAAGNRFWFVPHLPAGSALLWLRRLVIAELVILLVVVGVTSKLVQQDPNVAAGPVNGVLYEAQSTLDTEHTLSLKIVHGDSSDLEMTAQILDESGDVVIIEDGIEIAWFHPDKEVGPITYTLAWDPGSSSYRATGRIPLSGDWRVTVRAEIDRFTDSRATVNVAVP